MELQLCNEPDTDGPIHFYEQKCYWMSNFSAFQVLFGRRLYATSEHAYQAGKFVHPELKRLVRLATSAHRAMKIAQSNKEHYRHGWDDMKAERMFQICQAKMYQHRYIQSSLLKTGNRELIEVSPIDAFWGWGPNRDGRNELGKIWMKLREELRAKPPEMLKIIAEASETDLVAIVESHA